MPLLSPDGLKLMLLGGFDARLNGRPVNGFTYNKMRALLAYLALEREQDHQREVLADLLWSGNDATTARGNLRRTLSDLRRVLELPAGTVMFSAGKHTIRFIPNGHIDALEFTAAAPSCPAPLSPAHCAPCLAQLEYLAGLYRGEFLAGLSLPDCPDFEDWLQIQREALRRRALALLEHLSNCHEQAGGYRGALPFALRHIELEPWNEESHRRAMRLYALNGQNGAALDQYDFCCRMLGTELGVLPCEETRYLAESIRKGEWRPEPPAVAGDLPAFPPLPAERRQATVLYCELTPGEIDDPDEAMERLHAPQARCVEIIRQFSGHIVQTHGGGLLAYFGYPQALEDAARRAVQAALAVTREAVYGIEIRAGVHTGTIITSGESSMPDTVGKTSRTAIQLRQGATHNEVTISQETHEMVAGYFDCTSLGRQALPGFALPLEIFRVERESGARTRLDAAAQLTPLVGRKAEIDRLLGLWEEAAQGARHVVLVQGEAGKGKSRLLHALKERLADQPHAMRELRCFPEFSQSPFHPLIAMLEAIFGFAQGDLPEARFAKLVGHLEAQYPAEAQDAIPLLALLLSLPLGEYPAPAFSPQKQKEQTIAILLDTLRSLATRQPVLLIVEDLHWIDPSTLELLTRFIDQAEPGAILALLTARPEFVPPWQAVLGPTLELAPLAGEEIAALIASLSDDLPAATLRRIVERADGVPLFAEEMAKIANGNKQASIPATLHDLLAARMDHLGEAKTTAQLAATLGREFGLSLLGKVSTCSPAALTQALNALQNAGLILPVNDSACQFKHALIQEAAYQSQTRADRQSAHRRVAQALQNDFSEIVETQPEFLAQHLSAGGETRQSIAYWIKAGQRAARNSANTEALEHLDSGLQLLMSLPPDRELDPLEFALRVNLGATLSATRGYGSIEAGEAYAQALVLSERLGDGAGLFKALWGMWLSSSSRIGHLHSMELAEKLLRLAEQGHDSLHLQLAHYAVGNSRLITGNPALARRHLEQAIALYRPEHHEAMASQYGENICVSSGALLSVALWLQGFPEQAGEASQQSIALARQVNHPNSLGYALCIAAMISRWMKNLESAELLAQEAMARSQRHGLPFWLGMAASTYGWLLVMQGQAAGMGQMQQCLDAVNSVMSGSRGLFLAPLNEARVHLGQFAEALTGLDETLRVLHENDDSFWQSEFHRLKGECLLALPTPHAAEAEACFNQALAISRRQGAKSLQLRATTSMARLWQQQGKAEEGRRLLEEIYQEFTEGFDTPDLEEAAAWMLKCQATGSTG